MAHVTMLLALDALAIGLCLGAAAGKLPLWPAVLVLGIIVLVDVLPTR